MFLARTVSRRPSAYIPIVAGRRFLLAKNPALPRSFHSSPLSNANGGVTTVKKTKKKSKAKQSREEPEEEIAPAVAKSSTTLPPVVTENETSVSTDVKIPGNRSALLSNDTLVVTRNMELAQILIGFEQANKYEIKNENGETVGYIAEETNIGRAILRSVTTSHRNFTATIFDANQKPILRVRRPFYFITSSMTIELPETGEVIGEINQKWHLWRRRYELFVNKRQVFSVDGELLAWDFNMVNDKDEVVASVNKNFTNLAREIFTDANAYVIRLGQHVLDPFAVEQHRKKQLENQQKQEKLEAGETVKQVPAVESTKAATHVALDALQTVETEDGLTIAAPSHPLNIDEKTLVLAAAIAIDFDYFSHTSGRPGFLGMLPFPMPMPSPYPSGEAEPVDGDAGGADAEGAAMGGGMGDTFSPDEIHDPAEGGRTKDQWGDEELSPGAQDDTYWSNDGYVQGGQDDGQWGSGDGYWEDHSDLGNDGDDSGGGIMDTLGSLFGDD